MKKEIIIIYQMNKKYIYMFKLFIKQEVIDEIKSGSNVFITGPAGSGKSYLLKYIIELYKNKNLVVTSSTGISAFNINGITLHNWSGIPYIEVQI